MRTACHILYLREKSPSPRTEIREDWIRLNVCVESAVSRRAAVETSTSSVRNFEFSDLKGEFGYQCNLGEALDFAVLQGRSALLQDVLWEKRDELENKAFRL